MMRDLSVGGAERSYTCISKWGVLDLRGILQQIKEPERGSILGYLVFSSARYQP
jgi:hypothetical protein